MSCLFVAVVNVFIVVLKNQLAVQFLLLASHLLLILFLPLLIGFFYIFCVFNFIELRLHPLEKVQFLLAGGGVDGDSEG